MYEFAVTPAVTQIRRRGVTITEVERGEGEDFGLQFENIAPRQCANECLFCFCKGNPPDARPALFFRDEDVRLSFLYGNYTTLTSITEDEMRRVVREVSGVQKGLRARLGTNFAFLGDEIYLRAGLPIPGRSHYGDYPQIEDGVGMVRSFQEEFGKLMRRPEHEKLSQTPGTIFTGTLF